MTGIPAEAGTADSADTPGTTSNGDAGLGQRERLLAAAAEDERVAALQPHDLEPLPAELDEQRRSARAWRDVLARDHERVVGRLVDELRRDEHVVDERVARRGSARGPAQ